jgi:hypothetical protein
MKAEHTVASYNGRDFISKTETVWNHTSPKVEKRDF